MSKIPSPLVSAILNKLSGTILSIFRRAYLNSFTSIPPDDDVLNIGLNRAVDLIASNPRKKTAAKVLGELEGKPVTVQSGRYGPYVQLGTIRATLPKDLDQEVVVVK